MTKIIVKDKSYNYPKEYFRIKMQEYRKRLQLKKLEEKRGNICNWI